VRDHSGAHQKDHREPHDSQRKRAAQDIENDASSPAPWLHSALRISHSEFGRPCRDDAVLSPATSLVTFGCPMAFREFADELRPMSRCA
jgi:hypothetical protein